MAYYLTPPQWNRDEYRDVLTANEVRECSDVWGSVPTGALMADGEVEYRNRTYTEALAECDHLAGDTLATACLSAHELDPEGLNPAAQTAYGSTAPLWE